ncbi:hypothetical protein GCM10023335_10020 [Streptomyces siamensis]|uniref:Secreted protein n=1 Tax=Streptomyces siamensis TaxID=1274986 RepID=A0ABP9IJI8_9ACTN
MTALCVVGAAGLVPLVTATAAQADHSTCVNYIGNHGYRVGPKVKAACNNKALDMPIGKVANPFCLKGLLTIHVRNDDAQAACKRA